MTSNAPKTSTETLQGWTITASNSTELLAALDAAFHYRGDVTITRKITGQVVEGYIFDLKKTSTGDVLVRLIPRNSDDRIVIPLSDIAAVSFTGKDAASGKSFET